MQKEILAPGILKFDFPKDLADLILNNCKNNNILWYDSGTIQTHSGKTIADENRNRISKEIYLKKISKELEKQVEFNIKQMLFLYQNIFNISIVNSENFSVLKYENGEKFDNHFDSGVKRYRTVSIVIYLNPEEYVGGELYFKHFNLNIKPQKSSAIIFPSNYPYSHSAFPIISGTKYSIVNWYNDLYDGANKNLDELAHAEIKINKIKDVINNNDE